jgi:hypothetical protein
VGCDTQSISYRGTEFAAQSGFCNAGDTTTYPGSRCITLPSGISQTVTITTPTATRVKATVGQQQPAYLARVLGFSTINIFAKAIAEVEPLPSLPCVLALHDPLTFQGSPTVSSPNCGVASNNTGTNAIGFVGNNGIHLNAPSYTTGGCAQTGGSQCNDVQTYQQPIADPLSGLKAAISTLQTSAFSGGGRSSALSYESCACYYTGNNLTLPPTLSGTYFINGNVKINGTPTITGTATLVFFGTGTLTITGNPTIQLTAETTPTVPATLSSVQSLMTGLLIYDGEPNSQQGVNISGNSSSYFNGTIYVPNADVTYGGNSSAQAPSSGCYQVIAYGVQFSGNTKLDDSGCNSNTVRPQASTVRLVQ